MDLSPEREIAVRWIVLNFRETPQASNLFTRNGKRLLVETAVLFGRGLRRLREVAQLAELIGDFDPVEWIARLVAHPGNDIFVSCGISSSAALTTWYLYDFGYRLDGPSFSDFQKDRFWDRALDERNPALVAENLRRYFRNPNSSEMGAARFRELASLGVELTAAAEHVPFASLASAIGRKLDRCITLWSFGGLSGSKGNEPRAIRWRRNAPEGLEEIILYEPSQNGPSALDFETRYAVAHELAHVALGHVPRRGPSRPNEEIEAHCLGAIFAKLQGAPFGRKAPEDGVLESILKRTDLPVVERESLLRRMKGLFSTDATSRVSNHQGAFGYPDATVQTQEHHDILSFLDQFLTDESSRREVEGQIPVW